MPTFSEEDHNFCQGWGEGNTSYRTTSFGLLSTAQDSELKVDLGKQLMFPETAAMAKARHGSDLRSLQADHPFRTHSSLEDRIEETNERKRTKCTKLVEECRSNGLFQGTSQLRLVAERLWPSLSVESMTCWASEGPAGNEALSQPWRQRRFLHGGCGSGDS